MAGISDRQLKSWEKLGLVAPAAQYDFHQLIALRTLARLKAAKLPSSRIRKAVEAVRRTLREVKNPLTELKLYTDGPRIHVQVGKHRMEPESGQLLLDFGEAEIERMISLPERQEAIQQAEVKKKQREAEGWFLRGVEIEQTGGPVEQAADAYKVAVSLDPNMAAALVNLGTIYFTANDWVKAEKNYARAIEANPRYPLAHFNLGNLYDERGDSEKALQHYHAALKLDSNYGDAHYNLAVLHQTAGETMKAVRHWRAYLKIDAGSPWADVARRELGKLYASTLVKGKPKAEAEVS